MAESSKVIINGFQYEVADTVARNTKINEPDTEGTAGQVLTTDGDGGRTWTTIEIPSVQIATTSETLAYLNIT